MIKANILLVKGHILMLTGHLFITNRRQVYRVTIAGTDYAVKALPAGRPASRRPGHSGNAYYQETPY